jgi:hypothetical protein
MVKEPFQSTRTSRDSLQADAVDVLTQVGLQVRREAPEGPVGLSGVDIRPIGPEGGSGIRPRKTSIIGVVIDPGLLQLSRIPWSRMRLNDRHAAEALIASLDTKEALLSITSRLASHQ